MWKAVISEPENQSKFGCRVLSLDDEWKEVTPVECLPSGSEFGIFLKGFRSFGSPVFSLPDAAIPDAEAEIHSPLFMQPGKAQRLECCDVETKLTIKVSKLGTVAEEAIVLKLDEDNIEITKDAIIASVKSLNHAYTKASMRLEPNRRGHGGRAYDHIAFKPDTGKYKTLEEIRKEHEKN